MALAIGSQLGPYTITGVLGKGGMGEVYRAHDPRLKRDVAIKVSAERFNERFEREARAVAALNHPNICQIYDVGPNYLVMELVIGESPKGPMELDDALRIAEQIAAALSDAHEKLITHRDLKPGNILVTEQGVVKVLDFGLAKIGGAQPTSIGEDSPTLSMAMTQAGMILGTAAYMSPEQARGKPVDARSDIWAFGVVLCELITGQRLFKGEDLAETLASVVKEKPDLSMIPVRVRRLIEACLEKDPRKRLQSIGDMRLLLAEDVAPAPAPVLIAAKPSALPWLLAAAGVLLAGVALWAPWRSPQDAPEVVRLTIDAPPKQTFTNWMSLSPDGRKVGFTARGEDGQIRLWVRSLDTWEAKAITTTVTNSVPFWSSDSNWLAYQMEGKLRKVEAVGGPSRVLCDAPAGFGGGTWSPDGATIIFGGVTDVLRKVSSNGGTPSVLTKLDTARQETGHFMPVFLPDGKHFLYHRAGSAEATGGAFVGSLDDTPDAPTPAMLIASPRNVLFAPAVGGGPGYILFQREKALMAQPFDSSKLALTGEAALVADVVGIMSNSSFLNAMVSGRTLILRESGLADLRQVTWLDRNGKSPVPVTEVAQWLSVEISPNGSQAAAYRPDEQGNFDVYTMDLARHLATRLTFDKAVDASPVWSPDGGRIVFASLREGARNLFWKPANGATAEELLFKSPEQKNPLSWSPDGRSLLFASVNSKTKSDLWALSMAGPDRKATLFLGSEANEQGGRFSPDGRFVVYVSDESGTNEVYLRTYPDGAGKWQVSRGGGTSPRWGRDGKEFFYNANGANFLAVKVTTAPTVQLGDPVVLHSNFDGGTFDVAPDGRFLMTLASGQNLVNPIRVVVNWQAALKK